VQRQLQQIEKFTLTGDFAESEFSITPYFDANFGTVKLRAKSCFLNKFTAY
jgi:hypothetical protein